MCRTDKPRDSMYRLYAEKGWSNDALSKCLFSPHLSRPPKTSISLGAATQYKPSPFIPHRMTKKTRMYLKPRTPVVRQYRSVTRESMPSFGAQINLLEGLRHVHFHPEARPYSWGPGLRQPGPFPFLGLCLDERAYDYFSGSVPAPRYNYLVPRG